MKGRSALVTGSTGGVGLAIAEALAGTGCSVMLHGLEPPERMTVTCDRLAQQYHVSVGYLRADLVEPSAIKNLIASAVDRMGAIDILVNNAVVRHFARLEEFPAEMWDRALAVNLSAAFHTIRLTIPQMRARGWGRIFNMTSVYSQKGTPNRVDYVTTKTALLGLTRAVAVETMGQGITCNAICPGAVHTPSSEDRIVALMEARGLVRAAAVRQFLSGKQPTGRFVEASHIGDLIVFLCGANAEDISGAMLPLDGGWLAS